MTRDAKALMDLLGVAIDVTKPMRGLSIADQQMVEIARALASDSRRIIMDEPTAPLTPREVATLFAIARRLRDEGHSGDLQLFEIALISINRAIRDQTEGRTHFRQRPCVHCPAGDACIAERRPHRFWRASPLIARTAALATGSL